MSKKRLDLTGQIFGKLRVVNVVASASGRTKFICACDCGNESIVTGSDLVSGNTTSCGCHKRTIGHTSNKSHGAASGAMTGAYRSYRTMRQRCLHENSIGFADYGGRGISICERWINSFDNFLEDMGDRPVGYSLERIDVNSGYSPENCKWVPLHDQSRNTRNTVRYLVNGVEMIQADLARNLGIHPSSLASMRKTNRLPEGIQALTA